MVYVEGVQQDLKMTFPGHYNDLLKASAEDEDLSNQVGVSCLPLLRKQ